VISIAIPPLRQRSEDIPALVEYFLSRFGLEYDRPLCVMSEAAIKKMTSYSWPGNVREIENCVRRAVLLSTGGVIDEGNLMIPDIQEEQTAQEMNHDQLVDRLKQKIETIIPDILRLSNRDTHDNIIEMVEDILVRAALHECGNNQVQAARILGISRNTLRQRLKRQTDRDDNQERMY